MMSTRDARIAQLRTAAQRKHEEALARANRAIVALENRGRAINFTTVANEAGVSRDFLYKNAALRRAIALKRGVVRAVVSQPMQASSGSAAVKLHVATDALRRLREENTKLRTENARLHGDLRALRRRTLGT